MSNSTEAKAEDSHEKPSEELNLMIDELLNDLTSKFTAVASEITAKMDDMSRRIDNLESSMRAQRVEVEKQQDSK